MNLMRTFLLFAFFLVLFFSSLFVHFSAFIYRQNPETKDKVVLTVLILLSGIFLGLAYYFLAPRQSSKFKWIVAGAALAGILFIAVSVTESNLSKSALMQNHQPDQFSLLHDHCGVYSGRAIQRIIDVYFRPKFLGLAHEFKTLTHFRMTHFSLLAEKHLLGCDESMDPIDCRAKWMGSFADRGFWDYDTREFFFTDVQALWPASKKTDALINYILKDQELQSVKQSRLKQIGVDDDLNDLFLLVQQEDELKNLKLTEKIFSQANETFKDLAEDSVPSLFKFREAYAAAKERLIHIPELEKDVERLKGKSSEI